MNLSISAFCPLVILSAAITTLDAQEAGDPPGLKVRVVVLGHQRMAQFTTTTADETITAPGIDGKMTEMVIPKGSPLEIRGSAFEYLPGDIFIENKTPANGSQMIPLNWSINDAHSTLEIHPRVELAFLQKTLDADGSESFSPYLSAKLPGDTANCLIAVVANPREVEAWKSPQTYVFDTSARAVPPGTLFFFNSTPFSIEMNVPRQDTQEPEIIEPYQTTIIKPGTNDEGRSIAIVKLISRKNGIKKQFYYNTFPVPRDGRIFMAASFDPNPNASSPATIVHFTDVITQVAPGGDGN
jgi:hypothetical protein